MALLSSLRKHRKALFGLAAICIALVWLVGRQVVGDKVEVQRAKRSPMIHSVVTTGRVRPMRVRLAPIASGTIVELPVREGARVVTGQVLLALDDEEALAALSNANAALAQATATNRKVRTITRAEAAESVKVAEARLVDALRDLKRVQELQSTGIASRENVEDAQTTATLAKSALRSAKAQERDLGSGGATVRNSEAAIQQAEANVSLAKARLRYTKIVAPVDGIVIARNAEVGDAITGNTVVLELAATAKTELVVEPDERNLSLLALGQSALASAEAFPDKTFAANINFIAPVVDRRRGTIEVRLLVPEPPEYLRPDMTVSVDIEVGRRDDALVVPIGSVLGLASPTPYVYIAHKGRVTRRDLEVGIRDVEHVEVLSGLKESDKIILQPANLVPGDRIRSTVKAP